MLNVRKFPIKPEIILALSEIDEFKGEWKALDQHTTSLQILGEVDKHNGRLHAVLEPLRTVDFSEELVKAVHKKFKFCDEEPGKYRADFLDFTIDYEYGQGRLSTADTDDIAPLMQKLVQWLNVSWHEKRSHPLILVAIFYAVFLQICPFKNGNLKTIEFLCLLLLTKSGYRYAPYLPLDAVFQDNYQALYRNLKLYQISLEQGQPDWEEWVFFFVSVLRDQTVMLRKRIEDKDDDLAKLPTLSVRIMKLFEEHKRLQMNEIIKLTRGRRSTIKLRIGELVDAGYLMRHGQARSTWYSLV